MRVVACATLLVPILIGCGSGGEPASRIRLSQESRASGDDVRLRRLWSGTEFLNGFYASSPSPDGRYVTQTDWSTLDLAVRDLVTGELYRLTEQGSWGEPELAEISRFSPDGRQIAYAWYTHALRNYELRILDFQVDGTGTPRGSGVRTVFSNAELTPYRLWGWSADGEILTTVSRPDRTYALALIALKDGSMRVLKSFDWREPRAVLSPDGRTVVYDFPSEDGTSDRDIHMLSADGRERTLAEGPGNDMVLAWLPGTGVLFHSERSGSPSVWLQPMSAEAPSGAPELMREDVWRPEPLGLTASGFYFGVEVEWLQLHTVAIDLETGQMSGTPVAHDDPFGGFVGTVAWSPDGQYLVHQAVRPEQPGFWLVLRSSQGDVLREFHFDVSRAGSMSWAPDGGSVFLVAIDDKGRKGLRRVHLESGEMETVREFTRADGGDDGSYALAPDGRSVVVRIRAPDAPRDGPGSLRQRLVARDLESGMERRIGQTNHYGHQAFSPDGGLLAYVDSDSADTARRLLVMPAAGGEPRELFKVEGQSVGLGAAEIGRPNWMPDARTIIVRATLPSTGGADPAPAENEPRTGLWKVPLSGGEAERLTAFDGLNPRGVRINPDGRRLAFLAGEPKREIWVLEGLPQSTPRLAETNGRSTSK